MKILQCHNFHRKVSGEDLSVLDEARLLRSYGHEVVVLPASNGDINQERQLSPRQVLWNSEAYRTLLETVDRTTPDLIHITNTFPLLSHSIYYAAAKTGLPVVQSVRNYRFACPNGLFFRNGQICEDCKNRTIVWPSVLHRCYKNSYLHSVGAASAISVLKMRDCWNECVDVFVALTPVVKDKMTEAGFPENRIYIKPNFVEMSESNLHGVDDYALFAGRFSKHKGILTLLRAWEDVPQSLHLKVIGEGELKSEVDEAAKRCSHIESIGRMPQEEVLALIRRAKMVVFPSEWYETFGRVIMEAFACGVPVIATRLGSMEYLVQDGLNGFHFPPGDHKELASCVNRLMSLSESDYYKMRIAARERYRKIGTPEANYARLMEIYNIARERRNVE